MWRKLKEAFYERMARHHHRNYQKWRERLWKIKKTFDPEKAALIRDLDRMKNDLDQPEATELNELLAEVLKEKEQTRWN